MNEVIAALSKLVSQNLLASTTVVAAIAYAGGRIDDIILFSLRFFDPATLKAKVDSLDAALKARIDKDAAAHQAALDVAAAQSAAIAPATALP
jgi:hypothetical protein